MIIKNIIQKLCTICIIQKLCTICLCKQPSHWNYTMPTHAQLCIQSYLFTPESQTWTRLHSLSVSKIQAAANLSLFRESLLVFKLTDWASVSFRISLNLLVKHPAQSCQCCSLWLFSVCCWWCCWWWRWRCRWLRISDNGCSTVKKPDTTMQV